MKKALIVIDIQNDYFPGGRMELFQAEETAKRAKKILARFRENGDSIFHVQHISSRPGSTFFLPDTKGAEIHESMTPVPEKEPVIIKHFPNSFFETDLQERLKEQAIDHLVIIGMMTHMCIDSTVRAAKDLGYSCQVIEDACTTKDLQVNGHIVPAVHAHFAFIAAINGYYASITTTKDYLEQEIH